ncbi:ABC transporter ATP-binding protein [Bacillus sp. TS-2]|nr:ABC transporter ATP-binding protein [Bacillus sp. TS-2]
MSQVEKPFLQLQDVKKSFGQQNVLDDINLSIHKGEFVSIVGKSGCGKSTLLRLIAGLDVASSGEVIFNKKKLESIHPDIRIMFQNGRLLPWKTVLENVGLGMKERSNDRVFKALSQVQLESRANDWPSVLSGGQKQRVSLARALIQEPSLLLLDEPLGALDALTRLEMQQLIENLWVEKGITALLVTHDIEEAVALSDRVILIENGKIVLDQSIHLSRPRNRTSQAFTAVLDKILKRVMNEKEQKISNIKEA